MFQSYQFRQINPDDDYGEHAGGEFKTFQSYQFRQINPDEESSAMQFDDTGFQSYQFRQINPDGKHGGKAQRLVSEVSIVSIQADQSRLGN